MDVSEEGQSTRCLLLLLLCANAGSKSCQTPTTPDPQSSMPQIHSQPPSRLQVPDALAGCSRKPPSEELEPDIKLELVVLEGGAPECSGMGTIGSISLSGVVGCS